MTAAADALKAVVQAQAALAKANEALNAVAGLVPRLEADAAPMRRFRTSTAARTVAEVLIEASGTWIERSTLADVAGVDPSGVSKVVKRLEQTGMAIERRAGEGNRVSYRVVAK